MKTKMIVKIVSIFVLWLFGTVGVVQAHEITPKTSQPAAGQALDQAPGEVVVVFTEELVLNGSDLQVFDASGKQVDAGGGGLDLNDARHVTMRVKLSPLKEGVYTVKWQVKLMDGDSTNGSYHFGIGKVQVPAQVLEDDSADAPLASGDGKSPGTGTSSNLWVWAAVGSAALVIVGAALFFLLRKKGPPQR